MNKGNREIFEAMIELELSDKTISKDEIKKAYYKLCKKYHPDQVLINSGNKDRYVRKYLKVQQAYRLLENVPIYQMRQIYNANIKLNNEYKSSNWENGNYSFPNVNGNFANSSVKREAKIFSTNKEAARQQARQQSFQFDRNRIKKEQQRRNVQSRANDTSGKKVTSEQEELLRKIETIWLAEIIHRQIEEDKKAKEKENIRKLKRAFLQREDSNQKETFLQQFHTEKKKVMHQDNT